MICESLPPRSYYLKLKGKTTWLLVRPLTDDLMQITHAVGDMQIAKEDMRLETPMYGHVHHPLVSASGNIVFLYDSANGTIHRYNTVTRVIATAEYISVVGPLLRMDLAGVNPDMMYICANFEQPKIYTPDNGEPEKE